MYIPLSTLAVAALILHGAAARSMFAHREHRQGEWKKVTGPSRWMLIPFAVIDRRFANGTTSETLVDPTTSSTPVVEPPTSSTPTHTSTPPSDTPSSTPTKPVPSTTQEPSSTLQSSSPPETSSSPSILPHPTTILPESSSTPPPGTSTLLFAHWNQV
jgi:hypothetical protein